MHGVTGIAAKSARAVSPALKQAGQIIGTTVVVFSTMEVMRYGKDRLSQWIKQKRNGAHPAANTATNTATAAPAP